MVNRQLTPGLLLARPVSEADIEHIAEKSVWQAKRNWSALPLLLHC